MPEQITKYPEVTLEVLKGAAARCGIGVEQRILKTCPPDRFCALPTGEICVYGIQDIPQMTQISVPELARLVCPQQSGVPAPPVAKADAAALGVTFAVGMVLGRWTRKRLAASRDESSG
jgi:hypothetical protein